MNQWIEDAKQGDQKAYEHMVRQYTGMALAVAYEKLRDSHLAEDAVQEAFAEAFVNLRKLRDSEAFPGWFKVIVERQCHRLLRRKRHRMIAFHEIEQAAGGQASLESLMERKEMQQQLHACIAGLTSNMRLAVQLFYFHGYSLQEISNYLGTSVSTLKKRLYDARLKLKSTLPVADFVSVFHDLYEGGEGMLHIVNGDTVADKLKQGAIQGDILVWREVYTAGPVFRDMAESGSRSVRARYLEQALGVPQEEYVKMSESQEQALQNFNTYKEIVLWFEHDLFDQTMLGYLLHWFAKQSLGETKLSLLCIGAFPGIELFRGLGQLSAKQMESLSGTWHTVGTQELELGSKVWEAYASHEIEEHVRLLREDTSALPFVRDAFEAHLSRLPSSYNGLGIVEQTTLEIAATGTGTITPYELFKRVGDQLNVLGMGDLEYWHILANMSGEPHPLLDIQGLTAFPDFRHPVPSFKECTISLTELGRKILAGEADWAAIKETDEWFGGLHFQGKTAAWRWNASRKTVDRMID